MTDDLTLVIAVATSATAIIALITLLRLEQQRRINQNDPIFLFPAAKIELLALMEKDAEGELGEEMFQGMPRIVRNTSGQDGRTWSHAVDTLVSYGLAQVDNGYLRITETGKRYTWKKYGGNVRAIMLKVSDTRTHRD